MNRHSLPVHIVVAFSHNCYLFVPDKIEDCTWRVPIHLFLTMIPKAEPQSAEGILRFVCQSSQIALYSYPLAHVMV